jgi:UDP-N-acetylglucosamine:LPS N-acetylglucosamine transferase
VNKKQVRILLAPLDWGLGHVTRCVPIMQHIHFLGHQVVFAGNTLQQNYIKSVFKEVECINLEGYDVEYARSKIGLIPKIIAQIPRFRKCIKREHQWLQGIIKSHKIDAVISDNRYGLYTTQIPCVLMTHQLQIRSGLSVHLDKILLKLHYRFIEKFDSCWIVDVAEDNGLSGTLAHPSILPAIKTEYIGLLSQCLGANTRKETEGKEIVLILLSGVEPQRSILSNILWKKALKSDQHIIYVEGSEAAIKPALIPDHISYHKRLSEKELVTAIDAAAYVICRSGYSTLMDLLAMGKKAILIPTPGQTEQEYLGALMHQKKIFMMAKQHKFDIQTSLLNASLFTYRNIAYGNAFERHKETIENWIQKLQTKHNHPFED